MQVGAVGQKNVEFEFISPCLAENSLLPLAKSLMPGQKFFNYVEKCLKTVRPQSNMRDLYGEISPLDLHKVIVLGEGRPFAPASIEDFFAKVFIELCVLAPEEMTSLHYFDHFHIDEFSGDWKDSSPAALHKDYLRYEKYLKELESYPDDNSTKKVLKWFLEDSLKNKDFIFHNYCISQLRGPHIDHINFLMDKQPLKTEEDANFYMERLSKIPLVFEGHLAFLKKGEELGIKLPSLAIDKIIEQLNAIIESDAGELFEDFQLRTVEMDCIDSCSAIIQNSLIPAYKKLLNYFLELQKSVKTNHGASDLPNGKNYYQHCLKTQTTTDLTPDEIHQRGQEEVARLERILEKALLKLGKRGYGTLSQDVRDLSRLDSQLFPNIPHWEDEVFAYINNLKGKVEKYTEALFGFNPLSKLVIKQVPDFEAQSSPITHYETPPLDNSRPGIFFVNMSSRKDLVKFRLPTLFIHEGIPGHHFQCALQKENQSLPLLRQMNALQNNAYVEGWALYVEQLFWEEGFYNDDIEGEIGFAADALLRAARLVVDTGIHAKGMTRDQACSYMIAHSGQDYPDIEKEIDRYYVWPAQACSYKIGQMKITELRERAKELLANKFNLREFHRHILMQGAIPLNLLEESVNDWIKRQA